MSDGFWMSLFGFLATVIGLVLTYKKAEQAELKADKARANAEISAKAAKDSVVVAEESSEKTASAIGQITEGNKAQHQLMNSRLDEMKRILIEAAKAEGVLLGKTQALAEQQARESAMAEGAKKAVADLNAPSPVAAPIPVQIVPADKPLPVIVEDDKKDGA